MSFAAAICSMVCVGIVPMRVYFSLVLLPVAIQIKPEAIL
jgi:hypothetical protein